MNAGVLLREWLFVCMVYTCNLDRSDGFSLVLLLLLCADCGCMLLPISVMPVDVTLVLCMSVCT